VLKEVATPIVEATSGRRPRVPMKTRTCGHVDGRGLLVRRARRATVFLAVRHERVHLAHFGLEVKDFRPQVAAGSARRARTGVGWGWLGGCLSVEASRSLFVCRCLVKLVADASSPGVLLILQLHCDLRLVDRCHILTCWLLTSPKGGCLLVLLNLRTWLSNATMAFVLDLEGVTKNR
jgi:hypothetical protein